MNTTNKKEWKMKTLTAAIAAFALILSLSFAESASPRAYGTKIGDLVWQADLEATNSRVGVLEEWAVGDDVAMRVEEAGETNAVFSVVYTNKVMFSSAQAESNILAKAKSYSDSKALQVAGATDDAIAHLAWGNTTSGGARSPTDSLIIEKKAVSLTGGGNYTYIESSTGGYWILSASTASGWTMQSLADAQDPSKPATLTTYDANGNAVWQITSTSSLEVYAIAGSEMDAPKVVSSGANDVITMVFPVNAAAHPACMYAPTLDSEFQEATSENWPGVISSSVWTGTSGAYTNTVTTVGHPGQGFFKGKIVREGTVYTNYTKPIGFTQIVIGDPPITYDVTVETINGKKLLVLTEH